MKNAILALCSCLLTGLPLTAQSTAASAAPYGTGCGLTLTSTTLPVFGTGWTLTTTGYLPGSFLVQGLALAPASIPLPPPFAPGCTLLLSAPVLNALPTLGPSTDFTLAIPNDATLKGLPVFAQSFAIPFGPPWTASNGIEGIVGT